MQSGKAARKEGGEMGQEELPGLKQAPEQMFSACLLISCDQLLNQIFPPGQRREEKNPKKGNTSKIN